ncbi:unnamed protein product [Lepeophtheirus salmonis]|uniref:(salmon louse) hypothetical protein n=1 Tax=Lepeophtheirus salmonis TaxID=72036 RepID=A0A7R8CTW8_LEPSM|nr:unnamed protein product [Lepeophtheirus salmonis]CAF2928841.1 unnamed protein product [Lepeophtheirus salmonis]
MQNIPTELRDYSCFRDELSILDGLVRIINRCEDTDYQADHKAVSGTTRGIIPSESLLSHTSEAQTSTELPVEGVRDDTQPNQGPTIQERNTSRAGHQVRSNNQTVF